MAETKVESGDEATQLLFTATHVDLMKTREVLGTRLVINYFSGLHVPGNISPPWSRMRLTFPGEVPW